MFLLRPCRVVLESPMEQLDVALRSGERSALRNRKWPLLSHSWAVQERATLPAAGGAALRSMAPPSQLSTASFHRRCLSEGHGLRNPPLGVLTLACSQAPGRPAPPPVTCPARVRLRWAPSHRLCLYVVKGVRKGKSRYFKNIFIVGAPGCLSTAGDS